MEAFAKVVEFHSFSKAAEALHLSQPTISAHVHTLETELGTPLLVRTPRGAHPSASGEKLYRYACEMLVLRERAFTACQNPADALSGQLTVVASSIPYQYLLPFAMSEFREQYEKARFHLIRQDSTAVEQALLSGSAELGLCGTCSNIPKLCYHELYHDELVLITPRTSPYSKRKNLPFSPHELASLPYIMRESGSGTRREAEAYLSSLGIELCQLSIVAKMDNPDAIKSAVSQGLGVSIVSRLSAEEFEQLGLLFIFQLGEHAVRRPLYLVRHQNRPLSLLAKRFEKHLLELYQTDSMMR